MSKTDYGGQIGQSKVKRHDWTKLELVGYSSRQIIQRKIQIIQIFKINICEISESENSYMECLDIFHELPGTMYKNGLQILWFSEQEITDLLINKHI